MPDNESESECTTSSTEDAAAVPPVKPFFVALASVCRRAKIADNPGIDETGVLYDFSIVCNLALQNWQLCDQTSLEESDSPFGAQVNTVKAALKGDMNSRDFLVCYYLGHGRRGTGDWVIDLETPSFSLQNILDLWNQPVGGGSAECLLLVCDCCFAGKWVEELQGQIDSDTPYSGPPIVLVASAGSDEHSIGGVFTPVFCMLQLPEKRGRLRRAFQGLSDEAQQRWKDAKAVFQTPQIFSTRQGLLDTTDRLVAIVDYCGAQIYLPNVDGDGVAFFHFAAYHLLTHHDDFFSDTELERVLCNGFDKMLETFFHGLASGTSSTMSNQQLLDGALGDSDKCESAAASINTQTRDRRKKAIAFSTIQIQTSRGEQPTSSVVPNTLSRRGKSGGSHVSSPLQTNMQRIFKDLCSNPAMVWHQLYLAQNAREAENIAEDDTADAHSAEMEEQHEPDGSLPAAARAKDPDSAEPVASTSSSETQKLSPGIHPMPCKGDGDCTIIVGTNKIILLDGGRRGTMSNELFCNEKVKNTLMAVTDIIVTHHDEDHAGGVLELLEMFQSSETNRDHNIVLTVWMNSFDAMNALTESASTAVADSSGSGGAKKRKSPKESSKMAMEETPAAAASSESGGVKKQGGRKSKSSKSSPNKSTSKKRENRTPLKQETPETSPDEDEPVADEEGGLKPRNFVTEKKIMDAIRKLTENDPDSDSVRHDSLYYGSNAIIKDEFFEISAVHPGNKWRSKYRKALKTYCDQQQFFFDPTTMFEPLDQFMTQCTRCEAPKMCWSFMGKIKENTWSSLSYYIKERSEQLCCVLLRVSGNFPSDEVSGFCKELHGLKLPLVIEGKQPRPNFLTRMTESSGFCYRSRNRCFPKKYTLKLPSQSKMCGKITFANVMSMALLLKVKQGDPVNHIPFALFTGDALGSDISAVLPTLDIEKKCLQYLDVPHHGSKYNHDPTLYQFLKSDGTVFLSTNEENRHGHPDETVSECLARLPDDITVWLREWAQTKKKSAEAEEARWAVALNKRSIKHRYTPYESSIPFNVSTKAGDSGAATL